MRFKNHARVEIVNPQNCLAGRIGIVRRLRMCDDAAWIEIEDGLPKHLQCFPPDHPHKDWTLVAPHECQPAKEVPTPK